MLGKLMAKECSIIGRLRKSLIPSTSRQSKTLKRGLATNSSIKVLFQGHSEVQGMNRIPCISEIAARTLATEGACSSKRDLAGKNVVFVAGLGGIGFETCKVLMTKCIANLILLEFVENPKAVETLKALNPSTNVSTIKCDITDKSSIKCALEQAVQKMKFIDILINGAGIIADRDVEMTMNVNLVGLINTTLMALRYMDKCQCGRGGLVVNIASVLGLEVSAPLAVYTASKFGVIGFTRSLAHPHYLNTTGVEHMAVCPGLTKTPIPIDLTGKDTFDYSKPLTDEFEATEMQNAADCAKNIVKAIEQAKNGNMFILDRGKLELVVPKTYWKFK